MHEFSGLPLVAGSIFGHRLWKFRNGVLRSPLQDFAWTTHEQISTCSSDKTIGRVLSQGHGEGRFLRDVPGITPTGSVISGFESVNISGKSYQGWEIHWTLDLDKFSLPSRSGLLTRHYWSVEQNTLYSFGGEVVRAHNEAVGKTLIVDKTLCAAFEFYLSSDLIDSRDRSDHMKYCRCGFYAYLDGEPNDFSASGDVIGVLEGYGETVIGTRGFRSQKARIVALAPHNVLLGGNWNMRRKLRASYPSIPVFKNTEKMYEQFPLTSYQEVKLCD